jgi:hypothetical protein
VRQSGGQPASHGRITKAGPAHARGMLVEAAWSAGRAAGPLRAFYTRVQSRRGMQVAVVATRKLTVLCWHLIIKGEDYAFAQPSLIAHKQRKLELRRISGRERQAGQGLRLLPQGRPGRRTGSGHPGRGRLPHHGRRLATPPTRRPQHRDVLAISGVDHTHLDASDRPTGRRQPFRVFGIPVVLRRRTQNTPEASVTP